VSSVKYELGFYIPEDGILYFYRSPISVSGPKIEPKSFIAVEADANRSATLGHARSDGLRGLTFYFSAQRPGIQFSPLAWRSAGPIRAGSALSALPSRWLPLRHILQLCRWGRSVPQKRSPTFTGHTALRPRTLPCSKQFT
jgi:hypothetical protein